jgi:hypothetical protein
MTTETHQPRRGLTFDDVWAGLMESREQLEKTARIVEENAASLEKTARIVEENAASLKETERLLKEESLKTDKQLKETDNQLRETDQQLKATDKQLQTLGVKVDRVTANVGGLNNDIGDFAEGLLTSDLLKKFEEYNLNFDVTLRNVEINEHGTKRLIAEVDWLLLNTTIALIGEAKARLTRGDVDRHITRMKKLGSTQNGLLGGKKLYGAVAGVKMSQKTSDYAKKRGLFVLEPSGDSVKIEAPEGKPAVW